MGDSAKDARGSATFTAGDLERELEENGGMTAPAPDGEQAVLDSLMRGDPFADLERLAAIPGHPLSVLTRENEGITRQAGRLRKALGTPDEDNELRLLGQLAIHYTKKGDLLYPSLKVDHGFSGPSEVMWVLDDGIRADMRKLLAAETHDDSWREQVRAIADRAEEMVYKEENLLLPLCAQTFAEDEWLRTYQDMKGYSLCLVDEAGTWEAGERWIARHAFADGVDGASLAGGTASDMLAFPTGSLTPAQVEAILNALPFEISFVDADDLNRYWNDDGNERLFKRPLAALGREVYSCHPPRVADMVRRIITSFRGGQRDRMDVWLEKGGEPVLVSYIAVRDHAGAYVGTLEVVQRMGAARERFSR